MISFFIDTSTNIGHVALLEDSILIKHIKIVSNNNLSTNIFKYIETLFKESNIEVEQVKKIFVAVGPGSFTGVRIGVTIAKTFAWAKNIEIIPLSSLEIMASSSNENAIIANIDARRGFSFAGVYNKNLENIMPDTYISLEELKNKYIGQYISDTENIDIEKIVKKHKFDEPVNPHKINPIYLKKTEAEENHA
ncbi:MAG: tRNA (adenosine(37)-N6)-threonylcarbamoyltransferase complex dimerization subunit type 1 TsaB [Bacilli bacterium]|nr:tRNA (adenosine(37)-N6)-threonylcarbamoyltransferase complex dimerization subunit type 1 TsaB [Bacilli bacterium]